MNQIRAIFFILLALVFSLPAHADGNSGTAMGFSVWAKHVNENGFTRREQGRITSYPIDYASKTDQFFNSLPPSLGGDQYPPCFEGWQQQTPYCVRRNQEQSERRERDEEMRQQGVSGYIHGADAGDFLAKPDEYKTDDVPEEGRVEGPTQLSDSGDLGDQA